MPPNILKVKMIKTTTRGFTLMEMIVVLGSFAILAVISTSVLFVALNNMAKARVTREVRRNGDSALQIMERQLRVAQALSPVPTECGGNIVKYLDQYGNYAQFTCQSSAGQYFIASGAATPFSSPVPIPSPTAAPSPIPLSDSKKVTVGNSCSIFICDTASPPQWVKINFSLTSNTNLGSNRPTEKQSSTWASQINIRYQ